MGVDYETVRRNNLARIEQQQSRAAIDGIKLASNLSDVEAAWLHGRRQEEAERHEAELHQAELTAFHRHCTREIAAESRHGDARNVEAWEAARLAVCVERRWPSELPLLQADPQMMQFQSLRSRFARQAEDHPNTVRVSNPMFIWGQ